MSTEQLKQLDFLLGHNEYVGRPPAGGGEPARMTWHGSPSLNGKYVDVAVSFAGGGIGRWTFGWNPLDEEFDVYYVADSGSQGAGTSPGWVEGEFTVTGRYTVVELGRHKTVRDVFRIVDESTVVADSYVRNQDDDAWIKIDVYTGRRAGA
ncbi:DUF1579 domain-containing protein [Streptomyces sp. 8L]|uniref:DUF1579 domain-containing protein n=1 Tax=Streptomyces sp. 8L TaxID=2877242 RepID=UPI001CD220AF|nr:DUF1579 domain-containing protein [Streptomyces sp. 8L]MCA1217794.1 DUF1579 domain-containing protein [Streptomyces sp. 8L]